MAALGAYMAFQSPSFWAGLGTIAAAAAAKAVKEIVVEQRTPEDLKPQNRDYRAGRGDDYWRNRSGGPPKD